MIHFLLCLLQIIVYLIIGLSGVFGILCWFKVGDLGFLTCSIFTILGVIIFFVGNVAYFRLNQITNLTGE